MSSKAWYVIMQTFQTAGVPPSFGSAILANMGSTRKRSAPLRKSVRPKRKSKSCQFPDYSFRKLNNVR